MAKRTARPLHDLPRTEEALAVLLRTVERHLQFIEPAVRRQATRLESLREVLDAPTSLSNLDLQRRLGEASRAQWAEGGPSFDVLVPYVDAAEMHRLLDLRQRARQRMATRSESARASSAGLRTWLRALADLVRVDEGIVAVFQRLQRRILNRLEDVGADARADTLKRIARVVPRNADILKLYFKIEEESASESSQNEIAIEFTEGDVTRARSLLRGVRRFRKRLRKRG
jgi:hypothetical protein